MTAKPQDVLGFWTAAGPAKWFAKSDAFDEAIRLKFEPVHLAAARGKYDAWAAEAEGALALVILLDQFPRNLYRDSGHAFATDGKARAIAAAAVAAGHDKAVAPELRPFFYLPYEHAESLADQETSRRPVRGPAEGHRRRRQPEMGHRPPRHHRPLRPLSSSKQSLGSEHHADRAGLPRRRRFRGLSELGRPARAR
jgi:uncharacterized protein (DUF924 family)